MKVPKCKLTKNKITQHKPRRGEPGVTNDAAQAMRIAIFKPGCRAMCKCAAGLCSEEDCNEMGIFDANDEQLCSFGPEFRAADEPATATMPVGGLVVYRIPNARQNTQDANVQAVRELNRRHREFWAVPE
jgi:hypothetical protein